jgi:hypothetical protein
MSDQVHVISTLKVLDVKVLDVNSTVIRVLILIEHHKYYILSGKDQHSTIIVYCRVLSQTPLTSNVNRKRGGVLLQGNEQRNN